MNPCWKFTEEVPEFDTSVFVPLTALVIWGTLV
jgi:hypothetical protein